MPSCHKAGVHVLGGGLLGGGGMVDSCVEASVLAAAGSFEASQRSAMERTSSGSVFVRGRASTWRASLARPEWRNRAGLQILRPDVERIGARSSAREIERGRHVAAAGGDLGQRVIAGGLQASLQVP